MLVIPERLLRLLIIAEDVRFDEDLGGPDFRRLQVHAHDASFARTQRIAQVARQTMARLARQRARGGRGGR